METVHNLAFNNPLSVAAANVLSSFQEQRSKLGLPNPGTVEHLSREMRDVLPTNYMFSGLRGDINKSISLAPLFQVSHQFFMSERMSPYTFNTLYGTDKMFLQGSMESDKSLSSRFNYRWGPALLTKMQLQLSGQGDMLQIENEYQGSDCTASLKMLNCSALSGGVTGTMIGSFLQSVTPRLSLGIETVWSRPVMMDGPQMASTYVGRYRGNNWMTAFQLSGQGAINASYWRKLSDKVQAGVDMNLTMVPTMDTMGFRKEGITTIGAKYQFRMATFRGTVDSNGKMAILLEKQVAPSIQMTFAADVDQMTQQTKLGIAVSLESGSEELHHQQEKLGLAPPPNIPF